MTIDTDAIKRAKHVVETYVRSLFAIAGRPTPGSERIGALVGLGMAQLSPGELRDPSTIGVATIGRIQQLALNDAEVGKPYNLYSAEAARAAQAAGGADGLRGAGISTLDALRAGSSARFRELAGESSRRSGSDAAATSGYASAASLNFVTTTNFTRTPFAAAGMDYATFAYVRGQDRALTGQNLLHAVDDAKQLGFAATDKEAIRDHAVIDHYSRDPRHANRALQDYNHRTHEDAELNGWLVQRANEKNVAKRAELDAQIQARRAQYRHDTGVQQHIDHDHPKAGMAVRNRSDRVDMKNTEAATLRQIRKVGADSVRDADHAELRATLPAGTRKKVTETARAEVASSAAKKDTARTEGRRSRWAMTDDDATPPAPEKVPSPSAEAAKSPPGKPAEPKKADTPSGAGKGEAKAGHPAKPATPARTRVAGAAGPSVG